MSESDSEWLRCMSQEVPLWRKRMLAIADRLEALEHRHRRGCIEAAQCRDNDFGGRYGEGMRDAGTHVLAELEGDHE